MSRAVLIACFVLVACKNSKAPPPPPAKPALAERVRDQLVAAMPGATVTIRDPRTLHAKRGDWEVTMSLDNLELTCRGGEPVCGDAIKGAIENIKMPEDSDRAPTAAQLVVTIKTKEWLDGIDKMLREKAADKYDNNKLVVEPVAGELIAVLGADKPTGITMVSAEQLASLKLEPKAAFELARKNMRATHATLALDLMQGTPVYTNREDDNYISAMMTMPDLWKPLAAKVKGDLLVAFPARNRVFATGSKDAGAVEGIAKIANVAFQTEDHPIAATIFKWSPTGWTVHAIR
jgi:hypothetical protein